MGLYLFASIRGQSHGSDTILLFDKPWLLGWRLTSQGPLRQSRMELCACDQWRLGARRIHGLTIYVCVFSLNDMFCTFIQIEVKCAFFNNFNVNHHSTPGTVFSLNEQVRPAICWVTATAYQQIMGVKSKLLQPYVTGINCCPPQPSGRISTTVIAVAFRRLHFQVLN